MLIYQIRNFRLNKLACCVLVIIVSISYLGCAGDSYRSLDVITAPAEIIRLEENKKVTDKPPFHLRGHPLDENLMVIEMLYRLDDVDTHFDSVKHYLVDLTNNQLILQEINLEDSDCIVPRIWKTGFNSAGIMAWVRCDGVESSEYKHKLYLLQNESGFFHFRDAPITFAVRYMNASNSLDEFLIHDNTVGIERNDPIFDAGRIVDSSFDLSHSRQLFPEGYRVKYTGWSSDDSQIAFMGNMRRPRNADTWDEGSWDLYLTDSELTDYTLLVSDIQRTKTPQWSLDGENIFFSGLHQGITGDWMVEVATGQVYLLNNSKVSGVTLTLLGDESKFFDVTYDVNGLKVSWWDNNIPELLSELQ